MANDLATSFRELLVDVLKPLDEAARDPEVLIELLAALGHTKALSGYPTLVQIAQHAQALIGKLEALDPQTLESTSGLISLLDTGREAAVILQELRDFAADPALSQFAQGLAEDVMSFLLASHLRRKHPTAFRIASLLTLIDPRETIAMDAPIVDNNGTTLRYTRAVDRFRFATLSGLLHQPGETLKAIYLPNDLAQGADAWLSAQRLIPAMSYLADAIDLPWRTDYRSNVPAPLPSGTDSDETIHDREHIPEEVPLEVALPPFPSIPDEYYSANDPVLRLDIGPDAASALALEILVASQKHPSGITGFIIGLAGDFNRTERRGNWKLTFSASGAIPALSVGPAGIARVPVDNPLAHGTANLLLECVPGESDTGRSFVLGSPRGTRLEIGTLTLKVDLSFDPQQCAMSIGLSAKSGALVLAGSDGDSFLSSVLPANGARAEFDLGLAWSNTGGLAFRGSAGLEATIPIDRSVAGITLSTLYLGLVAKDDRLTMEVSAGVGAKIGPVQVAVDRLGLAAAVTLPENGGNLGVADLDFHFKAPTGLGLAIDASAVVGGGFMNFDPVKGEYSGMMQLEIADRINVKAFGLLSTRLPDGSKGYSLIVFITAEDFQPIQLGLGFKLEGIGGMLAINRTFDEAALREGLKNNTLGTLLFPVDPVRNAPEILRNLATVFPARIGSYLFGPMAKIGWATPTLIQMELALILEIGARRRLLVLGRISSILPSRDKDLIRLNMDAMGVFDFDVGTISLDAVLVDSRLLQKFVLTGSMAMRACLVPARAGFALAVGGMNPHFSPPVSMPKLDRITINLTSGDNPRFTCDAYFAVTANTIQFGSRATLYAAAYGFSVEGDVGFDVLVQLLPFHFLADFEASIQLKHGSTNLFMVRVTGALEGPRPLRVRAKATFEIFWCDFSIDFDKTLIDGEQPAPPPSVNALDELTRALSLPESWNADLPRERRHGVTMRKLPVGAPLSLDPLGELMVRQSVLPLNTNRDLDVFGGAPLSGARRFTITAATLNSTTQSVRPARDLFAPAQFFDLSDEDKLASPSFEEMDSGVVFGNDTIVFDESTSQRVYAPLEFETIIIDEAGLEAPVAAPYVLNGNRLRQQAGFSSVAKAAVRNTGLARFRNTAAAPTVTMATPDWVVASTTDLNVLAPDSIAGMSWGDARVAVEGLRHGHVGGAPQWQLVPAYELVR